MTEEPAAFAHRYGPWALVAGASEGIGLAYAEAMAQRGLNVVLLSRRQSVLDDVASGIAGRWPVETRTVALDLSDEDAADRIEAATGDLDIGMLMYCAGADPIFAEFLDNPIDAADAMVRRNCLTPMRLCHHLAAPMADRGRGGIVIVSSGAALVGARRMVAYAATKAFDLVMGEALWAELHQEGVDVLSLVLGLTDTPALRRLLAERGNLSGPDDGTVLPGAATPEDVVREALDHLSDGPTWFVGDMLREGSTHLGAMPRSEAVRLMLHAGAGIMDEKLS
jgi:uncharacterized protein